ncbi:MAG: histidinol dehydrogenase [Desulfobacteraceae bacterium]|nr:histidinol dehydrogenase [Desulfobacteraceae bacterium]
MKIYNYPSASAEKKLAGILNRSLTIRKKDMAAVDRILEDVRKNGDSALIRYTRKFDSPTLAPESLQVSRQEMEAANKQVDKPFTRSLNRAIRQIRSFHTQQLPLSWIDKSRPGTMLGQLVNPVAAAGIYVPGGQGGKTPLVSSVLMCGLPAKIAGVEKVVMVTPPTRDGKVDPHLLVAAQKVGVDAVYKTGSAWAIAALAYGTGTIPRVDVIAGPGNIWVTIAKKLVAGAVGIDMIAGPSEILIIADHTADPEFVAADLLSQAEHDPLSSSVLVTTSSGLAQQTAKAAERRLKGLARREIARESLDNFGAILVVPAIDDAIDLSNRIAPEHLELQIDSPFDHISRVRNAGAVFMGHYTPEPVGDYIAGPNHVLPTAGTARFSSALSVENFIKKTSLIHYSKEAFEKEAGDIIHLAGIEGLGAHAESIAVRLETDKK